jgi:hypothetical protein
MITLTPNRRTLLGVLAVALVATGVGVWLTLRGDDTAPPPRERQYKATTACLLTDDQGLNGDTAKAAWAGMQEASLATLIKVQYLAITGPQTAANGVTYYNTLGVQQCTVIIAAGPTPVAAMVEGSGSFPAVKQVAIGGDTKGKPFTTVDANSPTAIQARVKEVVAAAA